MKETERKGKDAVKNRVLVANRQRKIVVDRKRIGRIAEFLLQQLNTKGMELSVALVSDRKIAELNRTYLGRSRPTDVLAFSQIEGEGGRFHPGFLGDVVISMETAAKQANEQGIRLEEELDLLLVHGILHLLGYEHTKGRTEATRMLRKQGVLLKRVRENFS